MSRLHPNGVNFRRFLSLVGPLLLAPNILQHSTTTIQADTTYVVVDFSLTPNRTYSIVSPQKSEFLSTHDKNSVLWPKAGLVFVTLFYISGGCLGSIKAKAKENNTKEVSQ
jgi:hypothetical protein